MSKQRRRKQAGRETQPIKTTGRHQADVAVMTNQQEIDEIKDAEIIEQIDPVNEEPVKAEPRKMDMDDLQKGLFLLRDAYKDVSESLKEVGEESVRIHKETNEVLDCHSKKLVQHQTYIDKLNEACCDHESRISSIELTMRSLKVKDVIPTRTASELAPTPAPVEPTPATAPVKALDPVVEKAARTETFKDKSGRVAAKGYFALYPDNRRVGPFVEARMAMQASPIGTIRAYFFWLNPDGSFADQLSPAEVADLFL